MKLALMHPAAAAEFDEAVDYYATIEDELADAFIETFETARYYLASYPLHFNIRIGQVRRVNLVPRFGEYYLPFMLWREKVVILAVAHAKRRPYYWRSRVAEAKNLF